MPSSFSSTTATLHPRCLRWMLTLLFLVAEVAVGASDASSCAATLPHTAVVFVKPHANTPDVRDLVRKTLAKHRLRIVSEREVDAATMDREQLIDKHYYAIASKATLIPGANVPVPIDKFRDAFGEDWSAVKDRALNAQQACDLWGWTPAQLQEAWKSSSTQVVKLGGGFYCGRMMSPNEDNSQTPYYIFNGFFLTLRQQFVEPGKSVYCWHVEWEADDLSWKDFRQRLIGTTDPATAAPGSLRRILYDQYERFGLSGPPDKGQNGVHGSASPWEGLVECANWWNLSYEETALGRALLDTSARSLLDAWSKDPSVVVDAATGQRGSLFDTLEELNADDCLVEMQRLAEIQGK